MKMEMAMAMEVAQKLEDRVDVHSATPESGSRGIFVHCLVRNIQQKWDVKSDLHQYPVFVKLEVIDE